MYKFLCRHMEHCCGNSNWLRHCRMFSKVLVSFYIPTSPHLLDSLVLDILVGMEWCFAVASVCISLMTNGIQHLFVYILAICINSLDTYLFRSFVSFFKRVLLIVFFVLLSCKTFNRFTIQVAY